MQALAHAARFRPSRGALRLTRRLDDERRVQERGEPHPDAVLHHPRDGSKRTPAAPGAIAFIRAFRLMRTRPVVRDRGAGQRGEEPGVPVPSSPPSARAWIRFGSSTWTTVTVNSTAYGIFERQVLLVVVPSPLPSPWKSSRALDAAPAQASGRSRRSRPRRARSARRRPRWSGSGNRPLDSGEAFAKSLPPIRQHRRLRFVGPQHGVGGPRRRPGGALRR